MQESSYHRFVDLLALAVCFWVARCRGKTFDLKEAAQCLEKFGYKWRVVVCKDERSDAVRYDSLVEEHIRYMRPRTLSRRDGRVSFR